MLSDRDFRILKKFKDEYALIENDEERRVIDKYTLIGWVHRGMDIDDGYKSYAKLTPTGVLHIRRDEIIRNPIRLAYHKIINFAK